MADMPSTSLKLVLLLLLLQICSSYILLERSPRVTVKEGPFLLERYNSDDPGAFVEIATSKIQAVTHLKDDPPSSSMEKVSKPKLERAPSSEPEQPEHQIVPEPEPLPESEPILTPQHDSPSQDATKPSSESDIEPSSEAEPNVERLAYEIENSSQDIVDETTEPSPVEGALGEILDEIYAEPVASLEPSEELKMTHQVCILLQSFNKIFDPFVLFRWKTLSWRNSATFCPALLTTLKRCGICYQYHHYSSSSSFIIVIHHYS